MAAQLEIPGVDYCRYALRCAEEGVEVPWLHIKYCGLCLLEYRRITACNLEWKPVPHDIAQLMFSEQARMFRDGKNHARERDYRRFYAHLADCMTCTRAFTRIVAGFEECDNNIVQRHWPPPTDQPAQNGRQLSLV